MIGDRLKELRESKKWSQKYLGELVNLSQQTIDHYEKGRAEPKAETLNLFSNIFNVSTDFLLGNSQWDKQVLDEETQYRIAKGKDGQFPKIEEAAQIIAEDLKQKVKAGTFECIILEPAVRENAGIFQAKGELRVWVTDDGKKMPVMMKTKTPFGSVNTELSSYSVNVKEEPVVQTLPDGKQIKQNSGTANDVKN